MDYCYVCGRIGHDNKSCRFVSREDGEKSGYGPELRTGKAKKLSVQIEDARSTVNEDIVRQPENNSDDGGANDTEFRNQRVEISATHTLQTTSEEVQVRETRPTNSVNVLESTGVNRPMVISTLSHSHMTPFLPPQGALALDIFGKIPHGDTSTLGETYSPTTSYAKNLTMEEECRSIISEAWTQDQSGPRMVRVCKKLRSCKIRLKDWHRRNFGELSIQIATTKDQLLEVKKRMEQGVDEEKLAAKRRQRNQIVKFKNDNGDWMTEFKDIASIIKNHFQNLYDAPHSRDFEDILSLVDPIITPAMNASLTRSVCREEVRLAIFQHEALPIPVFGAACLREGAYCKVVFNGLWVTVN
ncbi:hypothetical protein Vadar_005944 [Vaccinium darrowii]|uniref:Uncharacterized protein n=1 Tax=Vaccinium darrowii TaxID=229202 RepID=A0ACB7YKJ8_9ERIC|nr:hypothetical protein Vadar_005944 [Vaccinium darrowii]